MNGETPHLPDNRLLMQQLTLANEILQTFYEWRYKLMLRFFVSIGALLAGIVLILDSRALVNWLVIVPGGIGLVICIAIWRMDHVNSSMMDIAYTSGKDTEATMDLPVDGVFTVLCRRSCDVGENKVPSYRRVLSLLYLSAALVFSMIVVLALFFVGAP